MKRELEDLLSGQRLSIEESKALMLAMVSEPVREAQVAACLAVFRLRGCTVDELDGFRQALLERCVPVDLGSVQTIDVCGTGGDSKSTINVSTIVSFLLAAMGKKVAKHGNYAVSSSCGSSNVLEALGIKLSSNPSDIKSMLSKAGVCFLHAPLFHPALKGVAAVRRQLGVRTIFNALGPLVNPARPAMQMSGVYSVELQRTYSYLLQRLGRKFAVVFSLDGYDEVSLTAPCRVSTHQGSYEFRPEDFGFKAVTPHEIVGGHSVDAAAEMARKILAGCGSEAQSAVVSANAGLALWMSGELSLKQCCAEAYECLRAGAALKVLERCVE